MKIKFEAELEEAVQFEVELADNIPEYAEHFLIIVNNVREYPNAFYKVENDHKNSVYVTCNPEDKESVREFLEWHGKIVEERRVFVCKPEYIYTRQTSDYISKVFDDETVWEIVTAAPEDLF